MKTIAEFHLHKIINETAEDLIYLATDTKDNTPCLIKLLKAEYPTIEEIARIKNYYNLIKEINSKSILNPIKFQQVGNSYFIVFENVRGIPLADYYLNDPIDLKNFLKIAINLTNLLNEVHKNHVVLRDFSPELIYINPATLDVTLLDLGNISITADKHLSQIRHNPLLLNFISPELTGRMQRKIDYRSNLYSLGILMYHMLTQTLPFNDADPMVILHSHIAQTPTSPSELNAQIPLAVSKIIIKCLEKIPEDRYQSSLGLKIDLETCLNQLEKTNVINPNFTPGSFDFQENFQISEKIYGRKKEFIKIKEIYDRTAVKNAEFILITGEPGIGKTSFISELHKFLPVGGITISGNYDVSTQHIQYSGLISALKKLIHQLLKEKEEKLAPFRKELITALQNNGQVIIDVIPELMFIIGRQPPVSKLTPEENKSRFHRIFLQFIKVFAKSDHPLTLILEDLQLADLSSLNAIKDLLIEKVKHLLIIGTSLPNDLKSNHILSNLIYDVRKENINIETINLGPLEIDETAHFVADSLRTTKEKAMPLAELLHTKTNGNPFFLNQLLKKLYNEKFIKFNFDLKGWQWDLHQVKRLELSENVVDLMIEKMRQFPEATQKTLSNAAAFGIKFSLDFLSKILKEDPKVVLNNLLPALESELIQPIKSNINIQRLLKENIDVEAFLENKPVFEFINFKIHQASDSLSSPEEKLRQHAYIGSFLHKESQKPENRENDGLFFEFINHLNIARSLITDPQEKIALAHLNLEACLKAKNSTANALALDVITKARQLLPPNSWKDHYDLTYSIFLESTDCSFLQRKFDEIEMLSTEIMKHAKTKIEKARLYIIKMAFYTNASQYDKVLEMGITCASLFDFNIPQNPSVVTILEKYLRVKLLIGWQDLKNLENLPPPSNEEVIFLQKLVVLIAAPAFLHNKHLFAYINLLGMQLILENGYCETSAVIYGYYGLLVQSLFKDYKSARELAQLSIDLCEKEGIHINCCRAYFGMIILVGHWTMPFPVMAEYLLKCFNHGLDSGELFFLSYVTVFFGFGDGVYYKNLNDATKLLESHSNILHSAKNLQAMQSYALRHNLLKALVNPDFRGYNMSNENFDEEEFHYNIRNNKQFIQVYQGYVAYKTLVFNLFGYYNEGLNLYNESSSSREAVLHFMTQKEQNFYHSLNMIGVYENASYWERAHLRFKIAKNQRQLKKWTDLCPQSNSHRYALVGAEFERVKGNTEKALLLYDQAIKLALENNFIGEAALANELVAKYYLKIERMPLAKSYMREAHYNYYRWGALSKTSQIEELYPELIENKVLSLNTESTQSTKLETNQDNFDLAAVIRASSILSKEIYLDKLLNEILRLLIVEAGADRAIFLMENENKWVIQGEKQASHEESKVLQALPFESNPDLLSAPIINFVLRTKEKVIINDVPLDPIFSRETYIVENKIKAILCIPIISQGKLSAILYLENKSATDVFSQEKIRILEILSSQIASSIENSNLYGRLEQYNRNLENKVLERTNEIQQKNQELAMTLEELKNTQNHLIESGKLAALGQLIAGIAHEINTPLGAVRASSQNASEAINAILQIIPSIAKLLSEEKLDIFMTILKLSTHAKTTQYSSKELRQFKRTTTQSFEDKNIPHSNELVEILMDMGIHEDLSGLLQPVSEDALKLVTLAYNLFSALKNNQNILLAVERASKIIFALKAYIHQDTTTAVMESANIIEGMESVLTLYQHQLKQNIQLERRYQEIPPIPCRINELNQVWTNLIHNSLQSMNNKGTLEIDIFPEDNWVVIQIADSGKGISDEVKDKIFTPFFTTKCKGEGSGLGLSISKKIVDAHGGSISFESADGRTVFSVRLPMMVAQEQSNLAISSGSNSSDAVKN